MSKSKASGYHLSNNDVAIVLGQVIRGDREHDIAAWFGVNQGRIAEAKDGSHGSVAAASAADLPPKGPPGVKGKRARWSISEALKAIEAGGDEILPQIKKILEAAVAKYDADES
jgi:hypothetical protein